MMSDSNAYIDGIFNYCDRWCERCEFTARCRLFATERIVREAADRVDLDSMERENAAFWRKFEGMIDSDIDDGDEEEREFPNEGAGAFEAALAAERQERIEQSQLNVLARSYGREASAWLRKNEESLTAPAGDKPYPEEMITADEALSILSWYVFQIEIKLMRGLSGAIDLEEEIDYEESLDDEDDDRNAYPSDADGSAKVALIGIERSLGAWTVLRNSAPQHDGEIRRFQQMLARLRRLTDDQFPGARVFHRPGFDDA